MESKGVVLIIDDEKQLRGLLKRIVELEDYTVFEAGDLKSACQVLERQPIKVVMSDVKLPDGNGVDFTAKLKSQYPHLEIIVMTAYGTIQDGVKAMKNGAFDYLVKGDDNEKMIPMLDLAMQKANQAKTSEVSLTGFDKVIGKTSIIENAVNMAKRVAQTSTTVLLTGETGTGKEVFAQAIHEASTRQKENFVAINCAAFSREILESELFGHKAGAFTGALKDKKGLFEVAHKGTIFLDEIGEMSLDLQAKLLRVLESGTFLRVGDTKEVKVDVRVISATNRDLEKESQTGHFRLDLYYRLSVFQIALPALRERKTDIALLSKHFIKDLSKKYGFQQVTMSSEFQQILENYTWPGNIRELKNIIERALILQNDGVLQKDCLPPNLIHHAQADAPSGLDLQSVEKFHIEKVLQHTKGNKTETARLLNIGLTTLYRKMEEYGISLKI